MAFLRLLLTPFCAAAAITSAATPKPVCDVLALSGGGSFGAVEMGILDALTTSGEGAASYDIITGISAGGLNSGFLSYYKEVGDALPDMRAIYEMITTDMIYRKNGVVGILKKWSLFDTTPLQTTLGQILAKKTPVTDGPLVLVGASNLLTEELDCFVFNDKTEAEKVEVLLATSAIPFAFPPRIINGTHYVDGGVISNEIINQVLGQRSCDFYNITFINAHLKDGRNTVTGLESYVEAVYHTVMNDFDSQLAQVTNCPYPKGRIRACYPTAAALKNYSILDFDNGAVLYDLGKTAHECFSFDLC